MAEIENKAYAEAYAQFESWLGVQPYWLQDAAWRIYHGLKIEDTQIAAYADMCIAQVKKESVIFKHLAPNEAGVKQEGAKLSILKLTDISGVNALAHDAELKFSGNGITVIYGLNGAGKSGFMRIFKQLSGSPYEEPIQPNVFRKAISSGDNPGCTFVISEDGVESTIKCDLSSRAKGTKLAGCDVFDTRISNQYITSTNNVSYQPFVFTVLAELSAIADRVSKELTGREALITERTIAIPEEYLARDDISWIRQMTAETLIPLEYETWSSAQEKRSIELPKLLDGEKVEQQLKTVRTQLGIVSSILDDLTEASKVLSSGDLPKVYEAYQEAQRKLVLAEQLFKETADEQDTISVNSDDWKQLWALAKAYYEESLFKEGGKHFGEEGSICPLCHQQIIGTTHSRFKNVNDYINGTCSEDFSDAKERLVRIIKALTTRTYKKNQVVIQLTEIFPGEELSIIADVFTSIEQLPVVDIVGAAKKCAAIDFSAAITLLAEKKVFLSDEKNKLEEALKSEERTKLDKENTDLQWHKWVFSHLADIKRVIGNHADIKRLEAAKNFTTTNKITAESNKLADALITQAYIDRFIAELGKLAPRIRVKLDKAASKKGSTPYKVSVDTDTGIKCRPEDILSEGEQRIVALAAFFADATGRSVNTPLIIDDPISSLDLNYETSATKRIVELAQTRQVIVFTHRISLLVGINEACKECGVAFAENHIRGTVRGKGLPDFEDVFRGDLKKQLNGIRTKIADTKRKHDPDSEEYSDAVGKICQQFRICIERSVEEVLLMKMVRRFERRIMTNNKVTKLTRITPEDCSVIDDLMTRYSFTEHSQPADSPLIEVDIDELDSDIKSFIDWITQYNKKMN